MNIDIVIDIVLELTRYVTMSIKNYMSLLPI